MNDLKAFGRALLPVVVLLMSGCVGVGQVHPPVPPIRTEQVPAPPPSRTVMIWQPGHWEWSGAYYAWTPGEWVPREGHGTLWQDGYWQDNGATSVWVPAHWL